MTTSDTALISQFGALAQSTRLAAFKALMRCGPDGMAAGHIASTLDVAPNTLSAHLSILQRSGLVTQRRDGRSVIYSVDLTSVAGLISGLVNECCDAHPEACSAIFDSPALNECKELKAVS